MSGLTFRGWLAMQAEHPDRVGQLARDHRRCRGYTDAEAFLRHLVHDHDTDGPELSTARVATKAYRRYQARRGVA